MSACLRSHPVPERAGPLLQSEGRGCNVVGQRVFRAANYLQDCAQPEMPHRRAAVTRFIMEPRPVRQSLPQRQAMHVQPLALHPRCHW